MNERTAKTERFRKLCFRCVLCNVSGDKELLYPYPVFNARLTVGICYRCMSRHGTPQADTISPPIEEKIKKYFARERAFWHPGEDVGTVGKKE